MQKRLVQVGDSLALVIDKAVLRVWGVTRMSRLSVSMEGGRLVITPMVGSGDPRLPSRREALQVVEELQQLGFRQAHFDRIAPEPMRLGTYVTRIDRRGDAAPDVAVTMCRMAELRRLLREGWNQRHAFAAAVAAHPYELPSGIETRFGDEESSAEAGNETGNEAVIDVENELANQVALGELELARREEQYAAKEREDQRLAQEARDRYD